MRKPLETDLLEVEKRLWNLGFRSVAGIDEAGRGPLAGPVVSACVVFEPHIYIDGVYDSKALTQKQREEMFPLIAEKSVCYGFGVVDNQTIDRINIYQAAKLSMQMAYQNLTQKPQFVLVDAMKLNLGCPCESIIKGDQKSFVIAAASILAKVYRDNLMRELHKEYPLYGWAQNKGYPTEAHREAIKKHGFSPYHRQTFNVL